MFQEVGVCQACDDALQEFILRPPTIKQSIACLKAVEDLLQVRSAEAGQLLYEEYDHFVVLADNIYCKSCEIDSSRWKTWFYEVDEESQLLWLTRSPDDRKKPVIQVSCAPLKAFYDVAHDTKQVAFGYTSYSQCKPSYLIANFYASFYEMEERISISDRNQASTLHFMMLSRTVELDRDYFDEC